MKTLRFPVLYLAAFAVVATAAVEKVKLTIIDPLIPQLAIGLGAFAQEGLEIEFVKVEDFAKEDYLMQAPLVARQIDASVHWFQHVAFGHRHNLPLRAVMMIQDSPGMKVLVAKRAQSDIRTAADFAGRNIAEGAGYATKSMLMNLLARRAGVTPTGYRAVLKETEGRQEAVINGLRTGQVDVVAFMEPLTSAIEATGLVVPLFDLTDRAGTIAAVGDAWPAHTVFVAEAFIAERPETVQRLVNAFVRTMRYVNAHTAEEIVARLPEGYFVKRPREKETARLRKVMPAFARGDYSFTRSSAELLLRTIEVSKFDESEEGIFRRTAENAAVKPEQLYDNRFVERAMKAIP